jgi:FtsP/CotA-like multicopper oxidase with cupredoxin domain
VRFQWEPGRAGVGPTPNPPRFMINDKQFEQTGEVVDQCMAEDALQDWVLENYTTIAHPFHIHVNPFQVLRVNMPAEGKTYAPKDNFVWQDTIAIPPAKLNPDKTVQTPGSVVIRHAFPDFVGTYVLHCHILAHEDRGMMQLVRVVPAAKYPTACQGPVPAHH